MNKLPLIVLCFLSVCKAIDVEPKTTVKLLYRWLIRFQPDRFIDVADAYDEAEQIVEQVYA